MNLFLVFFRSISFNILLLFHRGPWGALSPVPENNAIAVNAQVCVLLFTCCLYIFHVLGMELMVFHFHATL